MKSLNINNIKRKSKYNLKSYLILFPLVFLFVSIYLYIENKPTTVTAIQFVLSKKNKEVIYETFDIYLENIGEEYSSVIKEKLQQVQFQEKERFNFVDSQKEADIVLKIGKGEKPLFKEFLLPVGHIYWIKDSVKSSDLESGKYRILMNEDSYSKYSEFLLSNYSDMNIEKSNQLLNDLENEDCSCVGLIRNSE